MRSISRQLGTSPNTELTAENAELLLSHMLDINGYTRVPLDSGMFMIVRQRDAKDTLLPMFEGSATRAPAFPRQNVWDWSDLEYKATHPQLVGEMSKALRNFMPPNTRIIAFEHTGTVVMTASIPVLKRLYGLIREMDAGNAP